MGCSGDTATDSACGAYDQVMLFFACSPIFTGTNAKKNQTCGRQENIPAKDYSPFAGISPVDQRYYCELSVYFQH